VGATAAAAPWVAPAVAPGLSAVRALPIYHIPQADCPYETDTFFFISRPLTCSGTTWHKSFSKKVPKPSGKGLSHLPHSTN
jgi:hypothetical protein